jgi:hypothetical protein
MTGHVRRRGERSWELKFDIGTDPLSGKRLTRYHSFRGTKREAGAELARIIHETLEGLVPQRDGRAVFRGVGDAVVGGLRLGRRVRCGATAPSVTAAA